MAAGSWGPPVPPWGWGTNHCLTPVPGGLPGPLHTTHPRILSRRARRCSQHGWGRIPLVPACHCRYGATGELGFWGASLPLHPGNATLPSTAQCPAGMLAFGDRVPTAAIPYVVHVSPPCVHTPHAVQPPQLEGRFSCLHHPREHARCLCPPSLLPYISPSPFTRKYWPACSSWQPHLQWKCIRHLH